MSDSKKGGWKDSNWYVSASGFWREYRKHKIGILGIIVLLFYVGMAFGAPLLATHDPSPNHKVAPSFLAPGWMELFDPTGVRTGEFMPDQYLVDPNANIIQTRGARSSEFSGQQYAGSDGAGYMDLTWEHSPSDPNMDWRLLDPTGQ
ncbi:MAG: hypothetical protein ACFFF4_16640, partial [Candidatus Thorarchaeota archaeon]